MGLLSTLGGIAGSVFGGPVGGAIGSALGGAIEGRESVGEASQVQQQAAQGGIDEQRRQFDEVTKLLSPFTKAGETALGGLQPYAQAGAPALGQQQALLGLQGPQAQQQAISALQASPQFQALQQQGENAILQNASATGGLRGGNVQAALAQFRPQILSSLIDQQYGRLGGIAGAGLGVTSDIVTRGQAAAAGQASSGLQSASNIGNLFGNQGAALAGGQMARGGVARQAFGDMLNIGKTIAAF
jgi:hypothetical protein